MRCRFRDTRKPKVIVQPIKWTDVNAVFKYILCSHLWENVTTGTFTDVSMTTFMKGTTPTSTFSMPRFSTTSFSKLHLWLCLDPLTYRVGKPIVSTILQNGSQNESRNCWSSSKLPNAKIDLSPSPEESTCSSNHSRFIVESPEIDLNPKNRIDWIKCDD